MGCVEDLSVIRTTSRMRSPLSIVTSFPRRPGIGTQPTSSILEFPFSSSGNYPGIKAINHANSKFKTSNFRSDFRFLNVIDVDSRSVERCTIQLVLTVEMRIHRLYKIDQLSFATHKFRHSSSLPSAFRG